MCASVAAGIHVRAARPGREAWPRRAPAARSLPYLVVAIDGAIASSSATPTTGSLAKCSITIGRHSSASRTSPVDEPIGEKGTFMLKPFITTVALISLCSSLALGAEKKVLLPERRTGECGLESWTPGWRHALRLGDGRRGRRGQNSRDIRGRGEAVSGQHQRRVERGRDDVGRRRQCAGLHHRWRNVRSHERRVQGDFTDPKPTRTTVVVSKLVGAGHVEITATARK